MPYVGKKPADIIATAVDTTTGTFSGEVDAASLDISGNIDVDGTTNLDAVDIDGAVDMASTLTVNDSVTFQSSDSSKPVLTLKNTNADTTPPSITFQKDSASPADNDEIANINFYGDDDGGSVAAYANLKVVSTDVSNGSEDGKMTIKTMVAGTLTDTLILESGAATIGNGLTLTDGNLVVASGHGINFAAAGNASGMSSELLDDYEEGTFTAQLSTDSTYTGDTAQLGAYTKIGDICFIQIRFQTTGTINSGVNARFGLPFTSANNGIQAAGFRGSVENIDTSVVGIGATVAANNAILYLNEMTAATTGHNLNGNDLGANFQVQIQGFYKTA